MENPKAQVDPIPQVTVSVIIPVYNDGAGLALCLQALAQQTRAPEEIWVVDNGSESFAEIAAVARRYPGVGLLQESMPGSYAARNRGIAQAAGEILAFTDADCQPAPDWIAQGVALMQANPDCGLVAGEICITLRARSHPVELYESVMGLSQKVFVETQQFGATANLFTWAKVMRAVGAFEAQLKSSGDVEWGQRVFAAGYRQIYGPAVRVAHPARSTYRQLARQASRHAGGFYDLRCRGNPSWLGRQLVFFKLLGFHLMPPVRFALEMAAHPQLSGPWEVLKVVSTLAYVRWVIVKSLIQLKLGGIAERL